MTTEQKLAHVQWYITQAQVSINSEVKKHFISMARGASGAWYADMTISQEDFKSIQTTLNDLVEETL